MNVILSTRNPSKAKQIKAVFVGSPIQILTLDQVGINGQGVEDGATLQENSLKKALFVREQKPSVWAMADDTGIFINALGGKPGVHTADWPAWRDKNKEITEITQWILEQLKDVKDRTATFETVVAIVAPDRKEYFFDGKVRGKLLAIPRLATQPNMPYASIFQPDGLEKVWGEMAVDEENQISHRGKAFQQARVFLENLP